MPKLLVYGIGLLSLGHIFCRACAWVVIETGEL